MEQRFISAIARDTYGRDARLAAGGGHSDLYMHMYKRETMILREDFRIRGFRGGYRRSLRHGCAVPRLGATREVARDEVVSHDRSPPA